jgi:hypothetical protein
VRWRPGRHRSLCVTVTDSEVICINPACDCTNYHVLIIRRPFIEKNINSWLGNT